MKTSTQPFTATLKVHDRPAIGHVLVGAIGCLLALITGVAAATGRGELVAVAIICLTFLGVSIAVFVRDPILAFIWLWIFEIFNAPLSSIVGYNSSAGEAVRQADELLVLLFLCLTIWRALRTATRIPPLRFILPGIGIALCGILGAVIHGVPMAVTFLGAWLGLKLWILIGITLILPWKPSDLTRVYDVLVKIGLFVAVLGFLDYLTHGAVSRALHTSTSSFNSASFRGEAVRSILPQPGEFSLLMSLLFAFTFSRFATNRKKNDLIFALLFAISVVLSLRLKGFLSLAAVAMIVALVQVALNNRGALIILLVGVLLIVGIYSVEGNVVAKQISTYTSSETTARAKLYTVGEQIADTDFPLGVGFGRFASYPSRIYYSPVYSQYELNKVYGLSRKYSQYIDDTSWPTVMGETGYGGFAIYLVGLALVILALIRRLRIETVAMKWVPLAALCALAVLLVDSLGEATLFDWLAVTTFAMILGPALIATRNGWSGKMPAHVGTIGP